MEYEYKIILNMGDEMFNVFQKSFDKDGIEIIAKKENVLFIKKTVQVNERNILTHSEDREVKLHTNNILTDKQIHRIMSMARMQNASGILFVDVTTAVHYLIQKSEEEIKNDGRFRWMMRQAFTKAKLEKAENNV